MKSNLADTLVIHGGHPLKGIIKIRGAKNAVSKEMVATLLTKEGCVLRNVSDVADVGIVSQMIRCFGGKVDRGEDHLKISNKQLDPKGFEQLDNFAFKSRIPILFCGPLLHRFKKAITPSLGGDNIGSRPINFHLEALNKMGAKIEYGKDCIILTAKRLIGTQINLPYPSVGATEQVLLTATLAQGQTRLTNAAIEPEIMDLISVLQKMGAIIDVSVNRRITIIGVEKLSGFDHTVIPDRQEAASWACAAITSNGRIFVQNVRQGDLLTFLNYFRQIGGGFEVKEDGIEFYRQDKQLKPVNLETDVHPGFMTDWQQPFVLALTQAKGISNIHETVYDNRFGYTEALNKMGAKIELSRNCLLKNVSCRFKGKNLFHSAKITGPTPLNGTTLTIPDLRGGFSYIIAALIAQGKSTVFGASVINRGYEDLAGKLDAIGAKITQP